MPAVFCHDWHILLHMFVPKRILLCRSRYVLFDISNQQFMTAVSFQLPIIEYLEETRPGQCLLPKDPIKRAQVVSRRTEIASHW